MKQWVKVKHLLKDSILTVMTNKDGNVDLLVQNKKDDTIGIFEAQTFGMAVTKAYGHINNKRRKRN